MRLRSRSVTVSQSYRADARNDRRAYLRTTMSITEVSGTSSPSRNHHFDSHMWQVVNWRSRSLTLIEMVIRSPCLHSGQVPGVSVIVGPVWPGMVPVTIALHCHLLTLPPVRIAAAPGDADPAVGPRPFGTVRPRSRLRRAHRERSTRRAASSAPHARRTGRGGWGPVRA